MSKSDCMVVLAQTSRKGAALSLKTLIDPVTNEKKEYLYENENFYEFTKNEKTPSTWFVNDQIIQDGSLIMATPVHPLFLCIPYLCQADNSKLMPAEDLFSSAQCLYESKRILSLLPEICDTKEYGDTIFFRHNMEKCLHWLQKRVSKAEKLIKESESELTADEIKRKALRLLSNWISPSLFESLCAELNTKPSDLELTQAEKVHFGIASLKKEADEKPSSKAPASKRTQVKGTKSITSFFKKK